MRNSGVSGLFTYFGWPSPAEGDHPPAPIADREHHAGEEEVAWRVAGLAGTQQPGLDHLRLGDLLRAQVGGQRAAPARRPAEREVADRLLLQPAPQQVVERRPPLGQEQPAVIGLGRRGHDGMQVARAAFAGGFLRRGPGHFHPRLGGEAFDGLGEGRAFRPHQEGDGIPMRTAAEAVEMIVIDVEGGRLLAMERTAALPVAAGFEQPGLAADQAGQRRAGAEFVEEGGRESHGPAGSSTGWGEPRSRFPRVSWLGGECRACLQRRLMTRFGGPCRTLPNERPEGRIEAGSTGTPARQRAARAAGQPRCSGVTSDSWRMFVSSTPSAATSSAFAAVAVAIC